MISIIIPVYNSEKEIEKCIRSVLAQGYKDFELILIDDGSKDNSYKICQKLAKEDRRIRAIKQENRGASATRNRGLELAKGKYVMFIDSDDYIDPNTLKIALTTLEKDKSDLVIWGIHEITEHGERDKCPKINKCLAIEDIEKEYPKFFRAGIIYSPCNKLYIKSRIKTNFENDVSLGEDLLFNLNYIKKCHNISFINKTLYFYNNIGEGLNNKIGQHTYENSLKLHYACKDFKDSLRLGHDTDLVLSNNLVASFNYHIRDVYKDNSLKSSEKKAEMERWLANDSVQYAIAHAEMPQNTKLKTIALAILRRKQYRLFHILLSIKGKL